MSVVAQTCSVPLRKLQLLSAELRLLKSAVEQLHGRFELLLAEVGDLQREHHGDTGERAGELELQRDEEVVADEKSDLLRGQSVPDAKGQPSTTSQLDVISPQEHPASSTADQSPTVLDDGAAPAASMSLVDSTPGDRRSLDEDASAPAKGSTVEATSSYEPEQVVSAITAAAEPQLQPGDADRVAETAQRPSPPPSDVIILSHHRQAVRTRTHAARVVGRWAAAIALLAISASFAAGLPFGLQIQHAAAQQLGGLLHAMPF
jgi:hypothetical protein